MKILLLGATGMLGHKLMQVLSKKFHVSGTVRGDTRTYAATPVFSGITLLGNTRADEIATIQEAINIAAPDVVINCIGIVKQLPAAQNRLASISINALFPHQMAKICRNRNIRFIHVSTDCVFSGKRGCYTEDDLSDADDLYGKTKFLGEVDYPGCLTLRTSIIGRELESSHGLIEWFLSQEGKTVYGYKKAIFSGLTTNAFSGIIGRIISDCPELRGVVQVASIPISKFDLLTLVKKTYGMNIDIRPDEMVINNRSLNADKFRKETNIKIPSWEYMIDEMYRDPTQYNILRGHHAQQ
ncbi:MAG: dTDP-4-dehydrorhamnose reductase family protein [Methanoregula sp.]